MKNLVLRIRYISFKILTTYFHDYIFTVIPKNSKIQRRQISNSIIFQKAKNMINTYPLSYHTSFEPMDKNEERLRQRGSM